MSRAVAFALMLLCASGAAAQAQVYRCGADGRSYSQDRCEGGRPVEVTDTRTAQQAAQTHQAVQRDTRQALEMERARQQAERSAARQGPVLIGWSKGAAVGEARCANAAMSCKASTPSKRRKDKTHAVTLHRGAESSTR
jgi:hypothetical protein